MSTSKRIKKGKTRSRAEAAEFVAPADHEAGFKLVPVTLKSGKRVKRKVTALCFRKLFAIRQAFDEERASEKASADDLVRAITAASVDFDLGELSDMSRDLVEAAAYYLAVGYSEQKRLETAAMTLVKIVQKA